MDNSLLITLSAQNALIRQMEAAANNIANVTTNGFKSESVLFTPYSKDPASIVEKPTEIDFVRDYTIARDMRPGALIRTDNSFDVALTSDGFFTIQDANGVAYTRDGGFTLDPNGVLVTHSGKPVLDNGGQPINIDMTQGSPQIGKTGIITQNGAEVATLGIASFARPGALDKIGDNLLRANNQSGAATPTENPEIVQGMIEGSNVVAIQELTKIMEINRAFEQATKLQKQAEDLRSKAINKLAQVSA